MQSVIDEWRYSQSLSLAAFHVGVEDLLLVIQLVSSIDCHPVTPSACPTLLLNAHPFPLFVLTQPLEALDNDDVDLLLLLSIPSIPTHETHTRTTTLSCSYYYNPHKQKNEVIETGSPIFALC